MALGYFSGVVDVKGLAASFWEVYLFEEDTNIFKEKAICNGAGEFSFIEYDTEKKYYFIIKDPAQEWEHRISSRRIPVPYNNNVLVLRNDMKSSEDYTGVDGTILIKGALSPYTMTVNAPFPSGITPSISGDVITADGSTTEFGKWIMNIDVSSANGHTVNIPLTLVFGLKAPADITTSRITEPAENTIEWTHANNFGEGYRVYRSEESFTKDTLPAVYRTLPITDTEFVDSGIGETITYHYMIETFFEGEAIYSPLITINAARKWIDIFNSLTSGTPRCAYEFDGNFNDGSTAGKNAFPGGNTNEIFYTPDDPNPMGGQSVNININTYGFLPQYTVGQGNEARTHIMVFKPATFVWQWNEAGHFVYMGGGDNGSPDFLALGIGCVGNQDVQQPEIILDYNRATDVFYLNKKYWDKWLTMVFTHEPGIQQVWVKDTQTNDPFELAWTGNRNLNTSSGVGDWIGMWNGIRKYSGKIAFLGFRTGKLTKAEIDQFAL